MHKEIGGIIGKTITGVIVKEGPSPNTQVFLLFSDDTYYELYSLAGRIEGLSSVHRGDAQAVRTLEQGTVLETVLELDRRPPCGEENEGENPSWAGR